MAIVNRRGPIPLGCHQAAVNKIAVALLRTDATRTDYVSIRLIPCWSMMSACHIFFVLDDPAAALTFPKK